MSDPVNPPTASIPRHEPFVNKTQHRSTAENARSAASNSVNLSTLSSDLASLQNRVSPAQAKFEAYTIAPSPPAQRERHDNEENMQSSTESECSLVPSSSLRISTDVKPVDITPTKRQGPNEKHISSGVRYSSSLEHKRSYNALNSLSRTPSLKAALGQNLGSVSGTSSLVPSPIISAMGDMTPLPSPLLSADSPGPWKKLSGTPPKSRDGTGSTRDRLATTSPIQEDSEISVSDASRRPYRPLETQHHHQALNPNEYKRGHTRNRSNSEYTPDSLSIPRRHITVSGSHAKPTKPEAQEPHMRREVNMAESRGLTPTIAQPPTPPPSESSKESTDGSGPSKDSSIEFFQAKGRHDQKRRRWRSLRLLGQGTFSRVMLATSQATPGPDESSDIKPENHLSRKTLVAVKVCEHGPRGGASEDRVEMSLKRELAIMQDIHHPSLVDLKAWSIEPTRAILVLTYCVGGDLFDVATQHRHLLSPPLLKRMFAELVGAVQYLHDKQIVHRDIKLENVLVNLTPQELADPSIDWATYPNSITTLTDLGLSRRIANNEKLETRCGSEDYAAPEVIMGQPYDGRATDAWSLGVLLYALLESRLPFDPHPGMSDAHRMRSRTSHRIARVEWRWVEYAGDDGDHEGDENKFKEKGLLGAMQITEGLLKRSRSRWSVEKVASLDCVKGAILVDGGVKFWEEEAGEEVV
ncbi:hypothetical protein N3K66_002209 [Trichothecium roseum]|uniref:Uncharacterized protein n=1 Tax=Trichothecium roseum TaxID=47278 RepID=A0ACC0VAE5_9HYPO|nr:hypothetical protein N3K66_002209 [Trichothecium roseum]